MPDAHSLLLFMAAGLALNLTPGPDMLYVAARSAAEGRGAGVASALGIGAGTLVHIAAVAFGLAGLLAAVPAAYTAVRVAGGLYLAYLGVRALVGGPAGAERAVVPASRWAAFRQGVVTNVLNPKVALFFLAFLPQFVDPRRGSAAAQVVFLGLLFDVSGTLVNLAVAGGASGAAGRLLRTPAARRWTERASGAVFVALGARLALGARR